MEIFIKVENSELIDIQNMEIDGYEGCRIEDSLDALYSELKNRNLILDSELEEKVSEWFEKDDNGQTLKLYDIKHWVSNRSFGELIDMYESGEIIKPDMQREFVWDALKCSRLIESIILGLPIPPLFMLEVGNSTYELVDGFQRLTALYNFVKGNPWSGEKENKKRQTPAKLSNKISKEIGGLTFEKLEKEYQRTIKRSTIPLIEFKQLLPDNYNSKYLIFERINTGSEKLNQMQIRKSLAHGNFMKSLYTFANAFDDFKAMFSNQNIKKDVHVEAFLRIKAMQDIVYNNINIKNSGINNILNEYCEIKRNNGISREYIDIFMVALKKVYEVFERPEQMFRRVESVKDGGYLYMGNLNVSIMEAFMGVLLQYSIEEINNLDCIQIRDKYCEVISSLIEQSIRGEIENPFSVSTGSHEAIHKRFVICEGIVRG